MNLPRNTAAIVLLTAIALLGSIVLLAMHIAVPPFLSYVVVTGVGAVAGAAVPHHARRADSPLRTPDGGLAHPLPRPRETP